MKLGLFNGLGMLFIILGPLIIDPQLKSHNQFPNRLYSCWHWILCLMCIPIGFGTYYLGYGWKKQIYNTLSPTLILILPAFIISFLLAPEVPHMGIVVWTFAYGFVSLFSVVFHQNRNGEYLDNPLLEFTGRLERLKATIALWQQITVYAGAGYLAFAIFLASVAWSIGQTMLSDPKERLFFGNSQVFQIMVYSIFIVTGPLYEALQTTLYYIEKLSSIKEDPSS